MEKTKKFKPKSGSFLEVLNYTDLLKQLVTRDLKLKYRRSFLGYLWSILNPLLIMIIMVIVFSHLFDRSLPNYPIYLLVGRTLYDFVIGSSNKALGAMTDNASLLKKTYVSKFMFPLAKITSTMVDYVLSLGALLLVLIYYVFSRGTAYFSWQMLLFPLVVVQAYIFACGLGFFLAQMHVFFRDTRYIYNAVTTAWMYCSCIFYPISILPGWLKFIVQHFNPLYIYIRQMRFLIWKCQLPPMNDVLLGCGYAALFMLLGIAFFRKNQDKFILYI